MAKHSHSPYTSTSQYKHKTQHPSHPLHKHNILQHSKAKKTLFLTTAATQQTFPQTPTVTTTDIKTSMRHIHTSIVSRHLATRGNNKILRTPPPHTSSSEETSPPHLSQPCPTQNKQIYLPQIILTQSQCRNTSISTMPPL